MSRPSPYHLTIGEDGRSVRCELDVHYLTDDQLEMVRKHVETLQAENAKLVMKLNAEHIVRQNVERENAKLRELVADMWHEGMCECGSLGKCATCMYEYPTRMRELGVDA